MLILFSFIVSPILFLYRDLSFQSILFIFPKVSFDISCKVVLLVITAINLLFIWESLYLSFILKNNFTGYRIVHGLFYSLNILSILFHFLLTCVVSAEKSNVILTFASPDGKVFFFFPLDTSHIFSMIFYD